MPKPSKAKTYFTVDVDGQPRTLFAVREGKTHDGLTIIMKSAEAVAGHLFEPTEVVEQRYSIHDSPSSQSENTIKHTLILANGELVDTHKQTRGLKDNLLTPLFFRGCISLDSDRYLYKTKVRDSVVSLGAYDPRSTILNYGLFASGRGGPKMAGSTKYKMTVAHFRAFTLYVPYCFTNLPSSDFGVVQHLIGDAPRINQEPTATVEKFIDPGWRPQDARAIAITKFRQIHDHAIARCIEDWQGIEGLEVPPVVASFLQEVGPGLLTQYEARQKFGKFVRRGKGVLPRKDAPRKLNFDLDRATFWVRDD